jgi:hypothetical protein
VETDILIPFPRFVGQADSESEDLNPNIAGARVQEIQKEAIRFRVI